MSQALSPASDHHPRYAASNTHRYTRCISQLSATLHRLVRHPALVLCPSAHSATAPTRTVTHTTVREQRRACPASATATSTSTAVVNHTHHPSLSSPARQVHARATYPMDRMHHDRTHQVPLAYAPGSTYRVAYEPGREYVLPAPPPRQSYVIVPPNRGRVQVVVSNSLRPFSTSDPHWSRTQYAGSRAGPEDTRIGHKRLISHGPPAPPHRGL